MKHETYSTRANGLAALDCSSAASLDRQVSSDLWRTAAAGDWGVRDGDAIARRRSQEIRRRAHGNGRCSTGGGICDLCERLTGWARTCVSSLVALVQRRTFSGVEVQVADLMQHRAVLGENQQERDDPWKRQPTHSQAKSRQNPIQV